MHVAIIPMYGSQKSTVSMMKHAKMRAIRAQTMGGEGTEADKKEVNKTLRGSSKLDLGLARAWR